MTINNKHNIEMCCDELPYYNSIYGTLQFLNTHNCTITHEIKSGALSLGHGYEVPRILDVIEQFEQFKALNISKVHSEFLGLKLDNNNPTRINAWYKFGHAALLKVAAFKRRVYLELYFSSLASQEQIEDITGKFVGFNRHLKKCFPVVPLENTSVPITFMYADNGQISVETREIYCPAFSTIKDNYPLIVNHLDYLINLDKPEEIGKFIFWWGSPGTGKTYMLRALAQEFKTRANIYYIIDPEAFIHNSSYFISALSSQDNNVYQESPEDEDDVDTQPTLNTPLKLFIIEDGLNYIMTDSSHKEGGAVSRLLNITDGLLGAGLRLLFVVTSNEKIESIDPAFLRQGRCLQSLEFPTFNVNQAITWLTTKVKDYNVSKLPNKTSFTLAELYSIIHEYQNPIFESGNTTIGFDPNRGQK